MYTILCILYYVYYIMYTILFPLYCVYYTMYTILCILYYAYASYHQKKMKPAIMTILIGIVKAYIFLGRDYGLLYTYTVAF